MADMTKVFGGYRIVLQSSGFSRTRELALGEPSLSGRETCLALVREPLRLFYRELDDEGFEFALEARNERGWIPLFAIGSPVSRRGWSIVPRMEPMEFDGHVERMAQEAWPGLLAYFRQRAMSVITEIPGEELLLPGSETAFQIITLIVFWFAKQRFL